MVRALKKNFQLGVMTDVALDPYTSHGRHPRRERYIINDDTVEVLVGRSWPMPAGVDMVAPSDMMDGRIGAIREALEPQGHIHTRIMAYSQYASAFYGPFRDAVGTRGARGRTRTSSDGPRQHRRSPARSGARHCRRRGHGHGQPGMPYLDVVRRVKDEFAAPSPIRSLANTP